MTSAIDSLLLDPDLNCQPIGDHSTEQAFAYMVDTAAGERWETAIVTSDGTTLVREYGYDEMPGKTGAYFRHLNTDEPEVTAQAICLLNPNSLGAAMVEWLLRSYEDKGIAITNLRTDAPRAIDLHTGHEWLITAHLTGEPVLQLVN